MSCEQPRDRDHRCVSTVAPSSPGARSADQCDLEDGGRDNPYGGTDQIITQRQLPQCRNNQGHPLVGSLGQPMVVESTVGLRRHQDSSRLHPFVSRRNRRQDHLQPSISSVLRSRLQLLEWHLARGCRCGLDQQPTTVDKPRRTSLLNVMGRQGVSVSASPSCKCMSRVLSTH